MKTLLTYGAVLAALVVADAFWLGVVARSFFRERIGHLMGDTVVWGAVIVFYLLFALGVVLLVVGPVGSASRALLFGALLGLVAYGTYDLTNHAVLRDWPLTVTLTDMAWGALLTATAAWVGYLVRHL